MIEQLIKMATSQISQNMQNNPDFNGVDSEKVAQTAGESIFNNILNQVMSGNSDLLGQLLSGTNTPNNHASVNGILNNVSGDLISKLGINPQLANMIASIAIPAVLNMLNGKVNQAQQNNGFDISNVLAQVLGGANAQPSQQQSNQNGLGGLIGQVLGGFGNQQQQQSQQQAGDNPLFSILGNILNQK